MAQDVGDLAHLDHEGALPCGKVVAGADTGKYPVHYAHISGFTRQEAADLEHYGKERALAYISGFSRHIGSGDYVQAAVGKVELYIVRDERYILVYPLYHGMAAVADFYHSDVVYRRAYIMVFHAYIGQGAQSIQYADILRTFLYTDDFAEDPVIYLVEQLDFYPFGLLLRGEDLLFDIFKFFGIEALRIDKSLLPDEIIRHAGEVALGDFKVIAEDLVVFDLQILYARGILFLLFKFGENSP